MPSFKKSIAWFVFLIVCGLSVIPLFIWSITLPLVPGAPMMFGSIGLAVLVGWKIYGAYADLKVELFKRSGFERVTKRNRLKTLKGNRKVWRDRLVQAKDIGDREYAIRGLLSAEADIAEILGIPYEEPEEFRGLTR